MSIEEQVQDITAIQGYIMKKVNNLKHGYTTLSRLDQLDMLCNLMSNWIEFQMEKEKLIKNKA